MIDSFPARDYNRIVVSGKPKFNFAGNCLRMPVKNKTNLAKMPLFPRFSANSHLRYVQYICVSLYQKSSEISTFWSARV